MSNSDHEQFIDEQMIELMSMKTELLGQFTAQLIQNNQFLSKLEEKEKIIKEQNTGLLRHNKELSQHNKELLQYKELAQYNKELSVKYEEKNNIIQKKISEIEEKELLLIRLSEKFELIINLFIFLLICFFFYLVNHVSLLITQDFYQL